jgi:hypothetical protein
MTSISSIKKPMTRKALEELVLHEAAGEWGCEDMTGVTIVQCDPAFFGRNWTVTHLQNEDLPAAKHTVQKIVERLGQQYDLQGD